MTYLYMSVLVRIPNNTNKREKPKKKSDLLELSRLERHKLERFTKFWTLCLPHQSSGNKVHIEQGYTLAATAAFALSNSIWSVDWLHFLGSFVVFSFLDYIDLLFALNHKMNGQWTLTLTLNLLPVFGQNFYSIKTRHWNANNKLSYKILLIASERSWT